MKMRMAAVVGAIALFVGAASADTMVFDNFGEDWSYGSSGYTLGSRYETEQGNLFTPSESGYFTEFWVAVSLTSGTNTVDFLLMSDEDGSPGDVLETISFVDEMEMSPGSVLHGLASGTTYLDSTQTYWLIGSTPDSTTSASWRNNIIGATGLRAVRRYHEGEWDIMEDETQATFAIGIPEPGTLGLLALAGLLSMGRRR